MIHKKDVEFIWNEVVNIYINFYIFDTSFIYTKHIFYIKKKFFLEQVLPILRMYFCPL